MEVRLSPEDRAFLDETLCARGETLASWVRRKLEDEREAAALAKRMAAAEYLCSLNFEGLTLDPDDLSRLLDEQHDPMDGQWSLAL